MTRMQILKKFSQWLNFHLGERKLDGTKIVPAEGIVLIWESFTLCMVFVCSDLWEITGHLKKSRTKLPEGIIELIFCDANFDIQTFLQNNVSKKEMDLAA